MARLAPKTCILPFPLSFVVAIDRGQFLRARRGRKPQICLWIFDPVCHSSRDVNISGFGGHIAISGYLPLSPSRGNVFIELAMMNNLFYYFRQCPVYLGTLSLSVPWLKTVFAARITVILTLKALGCMSQHERKILPPSK